jgi:hypothetical protein
MTPDLSNSRKSGLPAIVRNRVPELAETVIANLDKVELNIRLPKQWLH